MGPSMTKGRFKFVVKVNIEQSIPWNVMVLFIVL